MGMNSIDMHPFHSKIEDIFNPNTKLLVSLYCSHEATIIIIALLNISGYDYLGIE